MPFLQLALPARFQVVRRIGEGGMGVVYEAVDVERDERIALKTILHHDTDTIARVKREFRALQDIHHPNLVALRELVAESDDVFFTMELVDGVDLLTWIRGRARREEPSTSPTAVDLRATEGPGEIDTDIDLPMPGSADAPASSARSRVRGARCFDESRLRDAFRQIALGLNALHAAGKVHRDIKPSNVRVTPEGRVVLLDFGLVFELDARNMTEGNIVGTPGYMAPEQASMLPVGPEADWYAVGVMLYECLTGRRPFEGAAAHVMLAKRYQEPLAPGAFIARVPRDLEELCMDLLRAQPGDRPAGADIMSRLQARTSNRPTGGAPFVGRERELGVLQRAFADVAAGRSVTVALHGESGMGKSAVARRFLDETVAAHPDVMVLAGRCYEREAVPYKALDEVIETLSRRLANLPRDESLPMLPIGVDTLALLFPAMTRVPGRHARPSTPERDPLERRRAAFRALRELFGNLARRWKIIVTIDDLQWTDADSLALLHEVLRPPDAPPLLLVVTTRNAPSAPAGPPAVLSSLPGEVRLVPIGPLASDDARRLAQVLLTQATGSVLGDATAIAAEAEGHPLFIDELVRHAAMTREGPAEPLRLDDALWRRVLRLDPSARRVLEVTSVLGAPASQETVGHAAGVDMGELARAVSLLRAANLVRTGGPRVSDTVEPYHDRVREALVTRMEAADKKECHGRIAAALELAKGSDPEVLSTHWSGAGEPAKAARHALVAAEQAAQALAFHRAARLCERALSLLGEGDPRRRGVQEQLGDALAQAGECARAAAAYTGAAAGAGAAEALDLRRRAADQLLRAGQVAQGLAAARSVLAAVGLALPRTALGALLALLWYRLRLALRGLRIDRRWPEHVDPAVKTRIDVCWSVAFTLPYADPIAAGVCHARHVLLALDAGDPMRAARGLAMEACYLSSSGFRMWPRAERLIIAARAEADRTDDPYARAIVLGLDGIACCAAMRFEEAIAKLKDAAAAFRGSCPGSAYEIATSQFYLFVSMAYSTRYGQLRPLLEPALADARERGDRYAGVMLRLGILNSTWVFAGDSARARRELDEARTAWPTEGFRAIHYQAMVAEAYIDLYEGEYEQGYQRMRARMGDVKRSLLLHLQAYRAEFAAIRGRLAFACAVTASGRRRESLLQEGEDTIRHLALMPGPLGRVNVRVMRCQAAILRGKQDEALGLVQEMADDTAGDAWLSRQCARMLLGHVRKDDALAKLATAELTAAGGLADPRMTRLYFAAFDVLEARAGRTTSRT